MLFPLFTEINKNIYTQIIRHAFGLLTGNSGIMTLLRQDIQRYMPEYETYFLFVLTAESMSMMSTP